MSSKAARARRQQKVLTYLDRKRMIQKLRNRNGGESVSEEEINSALAFSTLERLAAMLPTAYHKFNAEISVQGGDSYKSAMENLPHLPLKKNVHWLTPAQQDLHSDLTLTDELHQFAEYVNLDQSEQDARKNLLNDIEEAVKVKWPQAVIQPFGSYVAGLSTFWSDLDVSVVNVGIEHSASSQNLLLTASDAEGDQGDEEGAEAEGDTAGGEMEEAQCDGVEDDDTQSPTAVAESDEEDIEIGWSIDTSGAGVVTEADSTEEASLEEGESVREESEAAAAGETTYSDDGTETNEVGEAGDHGDASDDLSLFETTTIWRLSPSASDIPMASAGGERLLDIDLDALNQDFDFDSDSSQHAKLVHAALNQSLPPQNSHIYLAPREEPSQCESRPANCIVDTPGMDVERANSRKKRKLSEDLDVVVHDEGATVAVTPVDGTVFEHASAAPSQAEMDRGQQRKQQQMLRALFSFLRGLGWVRKIETRARARVPIINLTHVCGVEADISLGLAAQDTSEVVQQLVAEAGPPLPVLASFLKIYLHQLVLDKPFTGGLGSFKLYVLLAHHIRRYKRMAERDRLYEADNVGLMLLSFLQYFGNSSHLNAGTSIVIESARASVSFDRTRLVDAISAAFKRAYAILTDRCRRGSNAGRAAAPLVKPNQVSASFLASLLDTHALAVHRQFYADSCQKCPLRGEEDKERTARQVMQALLQKQPSHGYRDQPDAVALDSALRAQPLLAVRLRSFYSVGDALRSTKGPHRAPGPAVEAPALPPAVFQAQGVVGRSFLDAKSPKPRARGSLSAREAPGPGPANLNQRMEKINSTISALKMKLQAKASEKNKRYL